MSAVRARKLQILVDATPLYDLLLTLWGAFGGDDKARDHTLGAEWFDEFRTRLSEPTQALAMEASPTGELWAALIPAVETAPIPHTIDAVIDWLETADPVAMRTMLLAEKFAEVGAETLAAAARGEPAAVAKVMAEAEALKLNKDYCVSLESFLELPADRLLPLVVEVLRRVRQEAFAVVEEEWAGAIERDAHAKQALLGAAGSPRELIESVTNGISYELPGGIRRLVLVPSVSLRPWTLITDRDDTIIVCYPVSEEAIVNDSDAPPSWLLAVYRALGDEKRLRLLRRLGEGPSTLAELTEYLGLAKSTVFHHLGVLRAAGLVRVIFDNDGHVSTYGLRLDQLPDQASVLDLYLRPQPTKTGASRS
ncbi:MAG TPA: ArsR family transcriptional regulator [Acidimicrobiia bacterium]